MESVVNDEGRATYFEFGYDKAVKERYAQIKTAAGKVTEVWYDDDGDVLRAAVNGRRTKTEETSGRTEIGTDEKATSPALPATNGTKLPVSFTRTAAKPRSNTKTSTIKSNAKPTRAVMSPNTATMPMAI